MPESLFDKVADLRRFPMNFAKLLSTPFLQNTSRRLLLTTANSLKRFKSHWLKFYHTLQYTEEILNGKLHFLCSDRCLAGS